MTKPTVHLICNAHLDPVWQWRWEEGCSEALSTFRTAVRMIETHPGLIFTHNEAVLYHWVRTYDPGLFRDIQALVKEGRWCIGGGWYLQPDANLPGLESLVRQILEGRRFFAEHFAVRPAVAYNFDSFGHSGGLPQLLRLTGYAMYIHMRPQEQEMHLPGDLYRWQGVDGSVIAAYRIAVGLYHTERDNVEDRLRDGTSLALKLGRDVPVFWGIGDHGGGATMEDLERIDRFAENETRVDIKHSTPDRLYEALKDAAAQAPLVQGDLQRVFTGCYTSLSRLKRRAQENLGRLVQTEALRALTWWSEGEEYPAHELAEAWRDHLFNDFHDILPGSCTEPAEQDALDQYGRSSDIARRLRLGAALSFNAGPTRPLYVPVTVLNTNPAARHVPVEVECMLDLRPKWSGTWHLELADLHGRPVVMQEEQPESLLPFNGWRRKVCFFASLPAVGPAHYELTIHPGEPAPVGVPSKLRHHLNTASGLVDRLDAGGLGECLNGPLMRPMTVDDDGDAWGSERWSYRHQSGVWTLRGAPRVLHAGPVRTITESVFEHGRSTIVMHTIAYAEWPLLEFIVRISWNEQRRRLKLCVPTVFAGAEPLCEIPGGAIRRPADGDEHVHGRWLLMSGEIGGKPAGLGIVNNGQHGFDVKDGEVRLSVLRSAAYCHEKGFDLGEARERKYMDQGVHDVHLLVTAGDPPHILAEAAGLADWLSARPAAYAHLPIGAHGTTREMLSLVPSNVRLIACKRSDDGEALIARLHETAGVATETELRMSEPNAVCRLSLRPFEIRTVRLDRRGVWRTVDIVEER
jgi:alpha-mannosidase